MTWRVDDSDFKLKCLLLKGLGRRLCLGPRVGPKGPPHLTPQGELEPGRTRGYHDPILVTQAWEHVGWGRAGMGRAPTTHPQGRKTTCNSEANE